MARRKYSQEYKQEAVLLVKQSGSPVAEIARSLGINDNVLRRWVKEYSEPVEIAVVSGRLGYQVKSYQKATT